MDLRAFFRFAGVFLPAVTVACHPQDRPGGSTAEDLSTFGTPSFGDLPPPDEPTTAGSSTGVVEPGSTGSSSTGGGSTGSVEYCGDGIKGYGEECDLGADNSNVGPCTQQCKNSVCGDGFVWQGLEECDEGEANDWGYGKCSPKCAWNARCGDGAVDPMNEQCDLGDLNGSGESNEGEAPCSAACQWLARLVFVSSVTYTGALGGVSGADLKCRALAEAVGLTHASKFRAWISDGISSPISRWDQTGVEGLPYALRNGRIVAANFPELVDDGPRTGISVTEKGTVLDSQFVWTNTSAFGEPLSVINHCSEWTSNDKLLNARVGVNAVPVEQGADWDIWRSERQWTSFLARHCGSSARLYCFEDGPEGGAI